MAAAPNNRPIVGRAAAKRILTTFESIALNIGCLGCAGPSVSQEPTGRSLFSRVDHMKLNDLVDRHEVAINSREFERQVRELGRVTVLGWVATFLLAATLIVVAATLN